MIMRHLGVHRYYGSGCIGRKYHRMQNINKLRKRNRNYSWKCWQRCAGHPAHSLKVVKFVYSLWWRWSSCYTCPEHVRIFLWIVICTLIIMCHLTATSMNFYDGYKLVKCMGVKACVQTSHPVWAIRKWYQQRPSRIPSSGSSISRASYNVNLFWIRTRSVHYHHDICTNTSS